MKIRFYFSVLLALQLPLLAGAISQGVDSYIFNPPGHPDKDVPVWTYRPPGLSLDAPIVFVCHGTNRNGETYRNNWIQEANELRFILIVPEFTSDAFPGSRRYNQGYMLTLGGDPIPREQWSTQVIEDLFDDVVSRTEGGQEHYYLYGHSAGGQFVQRLLFFLPDIRVAKAVIANPGWYTVADTAIEYPFGLDNSPFDLELLGERLGEGHALLLSENDNDPNANSLNRSPEADAQGTNRFDRGLFFHAHTGEFAQSNDFDFNWSLAFAPNIAHSNSDVSPYAARLLFSDWKQVGAYLYNGDGSEITQDFSRGLPASTNNNNEWIDNETFPGWYIEFAETGVPETYRINHLTTAGSVQQWRANETATEGFIGGRASDTSGDIHYALRITNNSGQALNRFTLSYTGVQFRNSNSGVQNTIEVDWKTGPVSSIAHDEGWVAVPELTFNAPHVGDGESSAVNVDPYDSNNRIALGPLTIEDVLWLPGESLWLRWTDENAPGVDHGIGIDSVQFSALRTEFDPGLSLELMAVAIGDSEIRLALGESELGFFYQLQASSSLDQWEDLGEPAVGNGPLEWIVEADEDSKFYRIYRYQP
ncbi:MAG: hypothetical protein JJU20_01010 [Opitutales bacterium]|nr:hypothetical protein [Opitutales bacterium]